MPAVATRRRQIADGGRKASLVARSIPTYDVVAASPHFLPVLINPMSRLPNVIPVARPVSGTTSVIRAITHGHRDGTRITSVVRSVIIPTAVATIIRPITGISRIIIGATTEAKRGGNCN